MEKRKRIQAEEEEKRKRINKCKGRELAEEFPEETIQYIQSFLNAKQGAQTTLVSKSWYAAWLTRPHLYFDQQDFVSDEDDTRFWKFVSNTFQRYEKLNLKIHTLKLWILHAPEEHSFVNKFIITALKMGATDLDFKIYRPNCEFALPHQVFAFQELSRLSVSGCEIGLGADKREGVRCSRLKSLALESVYTKSHIVWDIISCCPSIENFSLSVRLAIKHFLFGLQHVYEGPGLPNAFHKLKRLSLYVVHFHLGYFDDFSSKFPCLEDLAFHNCNPCHVIKISSPSLQRITYTDDEHRVIRLVFDVPRIRKFTFSGIDIPLLSFEPTTSTWESDISIERKYGLAGRWFLRLRELLKELSHSKVSLSLKFLSETSSVCTGDFRRVPDKSEVENLTVKGPEDLDSDVFNYLFQCCRPSYVSHYAFPKKCTAGELKTECKKCTSGALRKKRKKCTHEEEQYDFTQMIQQVSLNSCIAYQRMTAEGKSDLEEVRAELYDESVSEWRLLDTSTALEAAADEHKIRLHLRWGR